MNSNILIINDSTITLPTGLSENSFGHTDLRNLIEEEGVIITVSKTEKTATTEQWGFEIARTGENGIVAFSGTAFNGKTLLDLFEENHNSPLVNITLRAVSKVIQEDKTFMLPGAGGIVVSETENQCKILIIPGTIFERCAVHSANYTQAQGLYIRKGLESNTASLFTRAVFVYKYLTGKLPFEETDLVKRQRDIFDGKFIPVELYVPELAEKNIQAINCALKLDIEQRIAPGEKRFASQKKNIEKKHLLEKASQMDLNSLSSVKKSDSPEKTEERNKFVSAMNKKIAVKRFFRTWSRTISVAAIAAIIALNVAGNYIRENRKLGTTMGLSSFDATQTFYTAINHADVPLLQEILKGKNTKNIITITGSFYVNAKQRQSFDQEAGTLTPAQWLFFKGDSKFWQYGITNLTIDGIPVTPDFNYPRRKDKKASLLQEDGKTLSKGDTTNHTAEYYLIHYDGDSRIAVIKAIEEVTLTWNSRRWMITNVKGKTKNLIFKVKDYTQDYKTAIENNPDSVLKAAAELKEKYSFVPSDEEIKAAAPYMIETYNNSAAKEILKVEE